MLDEKVSSLFELVNFDYHVVFVFLDELTILFGCIQSEFSSSFFNLKFKIFILRCEFAYGFVLIVCRDMQGFTNAPCHEIKLYLVAIDGIFFIFVVEFHFNIILV